MNAWRSKWILCLSLALLASPPVAAKPGDAESGEAIYATRCVLCHGEEGDGLGPAAERLNPPPRDFTFGQYKIKTTGFEDIVPNDADLFRMIRDGMPGTAMPTPTAGSPLCCAASISAHARSTNSAPTSAPARPSRASPGTRFRAHELRVPRRRNEQVSQARPRYPASSVAAMPTMRKPGPRSSSGW